MKNGIVSAEDVEKYGRLDAEFYLNLKVRCSECPQEFPKYDSLIEERKISHEAKHTRGKLFKGRTNGGGNNIIAKVRWIDVVPRKSRTDGSFIGHTYEDNYKRSLTKNG